MSEKNKGPLYGSAHCLYPDIMKLCIQTPIGMEFHTEWVQWMQPPWMLADYYTKGSYPTERAGRLTEDQQGINWKA